MERKEYNGWTNYETWLINLWMSNDEGSDSYYREIAEEIIKGADEQDEATDELAQRIQDEHEERAEGATGANGWISDLVNAALSEVDWREIAQHYVDDMWADHHETLSPEEQSDTGAQS